MGEAYQREKSGVSWVLLGITRGLLRGSLL
jgi:hypothetical protein